MTEVLNPRKSTSMNDSASQEQLVRSLDDLLERYLQLLDQYQTLQQELGKHLSAGYFSLAQANFKSPNRIRYGQDFYDERMQASRRVTILSSVSSSSPTFTVTASPDTPVESHDRSTSSVKEKPPAAEEQTVRSNDAKPAPNTKGPCCDPLKWFGILVPPALRASQEQFSCAVLESIPTLASVNEEMRSVEEAIRTKRRELGRGQ